MDFRYQSGAEHITVRVEPAGAGYTVTIGDRVLKVEAARWQDGELRLSVDGRTHAVCVAADGPERWASAGGRTYRLTVPQAEKRARRGAASGARHDVLEAPMPGVVRQVLVSAGDGVERGQVLAVLEAMKMEIRVAAPHAGRVERVAVRAGENVQRGQLLVDLLEQDD